MLWVDRQKIACGSHAAECQNFTGVSLWSYDLHRSSQCTSSGCVSLLEHAAIRPTNSVHCRHFANVAYHLNWFCCYVSFYLTLPFDNAHDCLLLIKQQTRSFLSMVKEIIARFGDSAQWRLERLTNRKPRAVMTSIRSCCSAAHYCLRHTVSMRRVEWRVQQ